MSATKARPADRAIEVESSEALSILLDILDDNATGVRRIFNVSIDDRGVFRGNAEIPETKQYLAFKINPETGEIAYKGVDAPRSDSWNEDAIGKTKSGGRKLNCRAGNVQCGGKCQGASRNCFSGMSPDQKKAAQKAARLAGKGSKKVSFSEAYEAKFGDRKPSTKELEKFNASQGAGQQPKSRATEKGGSLAPSTGSLAKANPKRSKTKPRSIEEQFASANPTDKDVASFAKAYRDREIKKAEFDGKVEAIMSYKGAFKSDVSEVQRNKIKKEAEKEAKSSTIDSLATKYRTERYQQLKDEWERSVRSYQQQVKSLDSEIAKTKASQKMSSEAKAKKLGKLEKTKKEAIDNLKFFEGRLKKKGQDINVKADIDGYISMKARSLDKAERDNLFGVLRHIEGSKGVGTGASLLSASRQFRGKEKQKEFLEQRSRELIREHLQEIHRTGGGSTSGQALKKLGLSEKPDRDQLKKAYRAAASKAHPDKPGGSADRFKAVNEAYEALKKQYNYDSLPDAIALSKQI